MLDTSVFENVPGSKTLAGFKPDLFLTGFPQRFHVARRCQARTFPAGRVAEAFP